MKCALYHSHSGKIYHVQTGALVDKLGDKHDRDVRCAKEKSAFAEAILILMEIFELEMLTNYKVDEVMWDNWQQYTQTEY